MREVIAQTVYFPEEGEQNTDRVLELAGERAEALGIDSILVASTRGETGLKASKLFKGKTLIVVTHCTGFSSPDVQELTEENRRAIEKEGAAILTCQHALGGLGRAVRKKLGTYEIEEIVAYALRNFGEGMKVAVEIALMAADAGLVRTDEEAIAIGGTSRGADTAIVVKPANAPNFFDLRVKEIICKPRLD